MTRDDIEGPGVGPWELAHGRFGRMRLFVGTDLVAAFVSRGGMGGFAWSATPWFAVRDLGPNEEPIDRVGGGAPSMEDAERAADAWRAKWLEGAP